MAVITLGVDVGTTSTKCLAVRDDGEVVASAQHPVALEHGAGGRAELDASAFTGAVADVVASCAAQVAAAGEPPDAIRALALSTQGDTLIPCDAAGRPVGRAFSWMDTRAQAQQRDLIAAHGAEFWYRETGQSLGPYSSACKLRWIAGNAPDVWRAMRRVACVPDYVASWLTGRFVADIPSASWSPFLNPASRTWSFPAIRAAGIDPEWLPQVAESGTLIGEVLPDVARGLGLAPGVRLVAGAFDQAAAALGAGGRPGGAGVLSCGTAWVLYCVSSAPPVDPASLVPVCCHAMPGEWGVVMPFPGGSAYDWFRGTFAPGERRGEGGGDSPIFVPHLYGGLAPDFRTDSRGALAGLTMAHTWEDVRLAVMRGVACEARRNVEAAERIAGPMAEVRMVGGAARSSEWPKMLADLFDRPVVVGGCTEAACIGAAALAAGDPTLAQRADRGGSACHPAPEGVAREEAGYQRYLHALGA